MKNRIWESPNNSKMSREKKRIGEGNVIIKLRGENFKKKSPHLLVFIFVALTFGVESSHHQRQCQVAYCLCFLLGIVRFQILHTSH